MISPPIAVVTFPFTNQQALSTSVVIKQAEFSHELAIIELPWQQAGLDFVSGTPVHVLFGDGDHGGPRDFYGYIDTVSQLTNTKTAPSTATCVGMTWPLKEARQQVWLNVTADGVAESLAAQWRLGVDLDASSRVWPHLAQAGDSDWTLLARLAHDVGFTLYPRGPLLCFHQRTRELLRLADNAPVFYLKAHDPGSELITFAPQSSTSVNSNARQQISVIDASGVPYSVAGDDGSGSLLASIDTQPTFTSVITAASADPQEANDILAAKVEDERFHIRANVTVAGDTRLRPAMPVYLGGLQTQWNGQWFVLSVSHHLVPQNEQQTHPNMYRCNMLVGRDGMGTSTQIPASSDQQHTVEAQAEIGLSGMWQCGPMPILAPEDLPPDYVLERLARNG